MFRAVCPLIKVTARNFVSNVGVRLREDCPFARLAKIMRRMTCALCRSGKEARPSLSDVEMMHTAYWSHQLMTCSGFMLQSQWNYDEKPLNSHTYVRRIQSLTIYKETHHNNTDQYSMMHDKWYVHPLSIQIIDLAILQMPVLWVIEYSYTI